MQARRAASIALTIIAWGMRVLAICLCALTVALCFSSLASVSFVAEAAVDLSYALPASVAGYGLVASPFGGVFRTDFALLALVLFLIDFLCTKLADLLG